MTVVALDAMGGDNAPRATVEGALIAARRGADVTLVGDEATLAAELSALKGAQAPVRIVHAPDVIAMDEHAALEARSRRESSIYVGIELVRTKQVDAFVSLGNTGAVLATAFVVLGRLRGVERPALGALLPRPGRPLLLLDAGANAEARVSHLVQFAQLGSAYMRHVHGVSEPRVALLNIGEESSKGSALTIEAHAALASTPGLRFTGNVESREIVGGEADVVVTDGFTGNVALKLIEGTISMAFREVAGAARSSLPSIVGGLLLRPSLERLRGRFDYRRYGGVPLLGVDGIVMIGHGRSDAQAVASAVVTAAAAAEAGMLEALRGAVGGHAGSSDAGLEGRASS